MTLARVHRTDADFRVASSFLKKVLKRHFANGGNKCLDLPCGNGRNIFLLAKYFKQVHGIDRNSEYLTAITEAAEHYGNPLITLEQRDVLTDKPVAVGNFDLVCNVHFYEYGLVRRLIRDMTNGVYFLLETPECRGGNFQDLPMEAEITTLIGSNNVLEYEFKVCGHKDNQNSRGSARILIEKIQDDN